MKKIFSTFLQVPTCPAAAFPGMVKCSDGSLVIHCSGSSAFESSDARMFQFRSTDGGSGWEFEGPLASAPSPFAEPFSNCCKPTLLKDGTLITAGYGFRRDRPEMGLSDYSQKFGRYPEIYNFIMRSKDSGRTWSTHEWIRHEYDGIENSGPVLQLNDDSLLFTGAPFVLNAAVNRGLVFKGEPDATNFKEYSCFFESTDIIPFETRSVQLDNGTIAVIFWAYDLKNSKNLNNHIVFSDDNGKTWSKAFDTGLAGQAANLLTYQERLFAVQARREGENPGVFINEIFRTSDGITTGDDILIWTAADCVGKNEEINQQFVSLKFGQPSVMIDGDRLLFVFWSAASGSYRIEIHGFEINL